MLPLIPQGAKVMVVDTPYTELQERDVVVFTHRTRGKVAHRLTEKHGNKWKSMGDNNRFPDTGFVTSSNYIGRVDAVINNGVVNYLQR